VDEYKKNPDPERIMDIFAEFRNEFAKKHANTYAQGFLRMLTYLATEEDIDSNSVGTLMVPSERDDTPRYFVMTLNSITPVPAENAWYRFGVDMCGIDYYDTEEMEKHLAPIFAQMVADGAFDVLKTEDGCELCVINLQAHKAKNAPIFHLVLDKDGYNQQIDYFEANVFSYEKLIEYNGNLDYVDEADFQAAALSLVEGIFLQPDLPRFRKLVEQYSYNLYNVSLAKSANYLTYSHDYLDPILKMDRAAFMYLKYDDKYAHQKLADVVAAFADNEVMKARLEVLINERNTFGGNYGKEDSSITWDNFDEIDKLLDTDNVIARAYKDGSIYIRFKIEGEQGYSETLDWLNALLQKQYAKLNRGYSIHARLLHEPVFIKPMASVKDQDGIMFPQTSCHAFFARAVQYHALREKVKRYAELALNDYDYYRDIENEDSTITGTFAALALAFCEEQYVPLAGLYGRKSDGEHQYIQWLVTKPLFKQWGATPAVACALLDLAASNYSDHEMYLPQAVLQSIDCMRAIVEHCESKQLSGSNHVKYGLPKFVEHIWSSDTKKNLKKLAVMRNAATTSEDKNAIADFHNLYKRCASASDKENYGDDMSFEGEKPIDVVVPQYNENPPLILSRKEAKKSGWNWNEDDGCDSLVGVMVIPALVDSLEMYDYVVGQWAAAPNSRGNVLPMSRIWWADGCLRFGNYIFNTRGMKYSYATILYDGKNKPFVLYGILNAVSLISRWAKHPFKTAEEAYAARTQSLIKESPEKPAFNQENIALEKRLEVAFDAIHLDAYWIAAQIAKEFTPEQGRLYNAALIIRMQVAKKTKNTAALRILEEELRTRTSK
jgi:hypothetical protein